MTMALTLVGIIANTLSGQMFQSCRAASPPMTYDKAWKYETGTTDWTSSFNKI
jgi:hypothetical protein